MPLTLEAIAAKWAPLCNEGIATAYALGDCTASALAVDDGLMPTAQAMSTALPASRQRLYIGEKQAPEGYMPLEEKVAAASPMEDVRSAPDVLAAIVYTGGTTGQPKGVMLTHPGLLQFGKVSAQSRQLQPSYCSYAYLPMTHIFGLGTVLMASLHAGAGLLMRSQFDPADVFEALAHQGLTQLQGPPAMFTRLLAWLDSQGIDP